MLEFFLLGILLLVLFPLFLPVRVRIGTEAMDCRISCLRIIRMVLSLSDFKANFYFFGKELGKARNGGKTAAKHPSDGKQNGKKPQARSKKKPRKKKASGGPPLSFDKIIALIVHPGIPGIFLAFFRAYAFCGIVKIKRIEIDFSHDDIEKQGILAGLALNLNFSRKIRVSPNFFGNNALLADFRILPVSVLIFLVALIAFLPIRSIFEMIKIIRRPSAEAQRKAS